MKILWLWVPWVPYQLLESLQYPSTCMPLSLQKALQRLLKQGPCLLWRVHIQGALKPIKQPTHPQKKDKRMK